MKGRGNTQPGKPMAARSWLFPQPSCLHSLRCCPFPPMHKTSERKGSPAADETRPSLGGTESQFLAWAGQATCCYGWVDQLGISRGVVRKPHSLGESKHDCHCWPVLSPAFPHRPLPPGYQYHISFCSPALFLCFLFPESQLCGY